MNKDKLEDNIKYCEIAIMNIMEIIQSDYIVHFVLNNVV